MILREREILSYLGRIQRGGVRMLIFCRHAGHRYDASREGYVIGFIMAVAKLATLPSGLASELQAGRLSDGAVYIRGAMPR